jgi:hypothetical protein
MHAIVKKQTNDNILLFPLTLRFLRMGDLPEKLVLILPA